MKLTGRGVKTGKQAKADADAAERRRVIKQVRRGKMTPGQAADALTDGGRRPAPRGGKLWNPGEGPGPHTRARGA